MNRPKVQRWVGKYEVGKTLGQGTFAKVRCDVDTETGERVALKILDKEKVLKHKMVEHVTHFPYPPFFMLLICLQVKCVF